MARPTDPPIGTKERVAVDRARYGEIHDLIEGQIRWDKGDEWGKQDRAIKAAAKSFRMPYTRAKRHYYRMRRSLTPEATLQYFQDIAQRDHAAWDAAVSRFENAFREFTDLQRAELEKLPADITSQLAANLLELFELRKQRKRK